MSWIIKSCASLVLGFLLLANVELSFAQPADKRVALVIGNGAYEEPGSALPNPPNDATAMAAKLRGLGFVVVEAVDQDFRGMRRAMREFDRALQGADAGLFYYAGHGMEYRGSNYLFPTDAVLETEGDVGIGLIDVDQIMQIMETTVPTRLLFLDACRNNPLARRFRGSLGASRSSTVGTGLARMDAAVGTFIAYATAPGDVAADGEGRHSPFTAAMLTHLEEPGLEIGQLMRRVRDTVLDATNERQVPWDSSSLRGAPFVLNLNVTINVAPEVPPAPTQQAEIVFWQSIAQSDEAASFRAYLDRFGEGGLFTELAELRIAELTTLPDTRDDAPTLDVASLPNPLTDVIDQDSASIEGTLSLDRSAWRRLQSSLTALGFDAGIADGRPGANTRTAIASWQMANAYPATGFFNTEQAARLAAQAEPKLAALAAARPDVSKAGTGTSFKDCATCPDMVIVPAGSFLFGSSSSERGRTRDEATQERTSIPANFAIGRFEVTQSQWSACAAAGRCRRVSQTGGGSEPVRGVGWSDAQTYVAWLSELTGKRYALPDERRWEYAARGGRSSVYPWGDEVGQGRAVCDGCGSDFDLDRPARVGNFAANSFGLYDTAGNVAEWTADCFSGDGPLPVSQAGAQTCERYVIKGGSYASRPHRLRSAARAGDFDDPTPERGLRVMRRL